MTCGCAETPQTSLYRALTVPVDVRKTYRHHLTGHKLYLWMCGKPRHHLTGHKLYLWMCGKPTDITSQGTNCTCGCAENLQTSPHRAQTVPVDVRKTYKHHLTGYKLYLCTCGKPTDITSQSTNCTCARAENLQTSPDRVQTVPVHVRKTYRHHLTGYKLYLCTCGKPTDITSQGTNCTCARAENLHTPHRAQTVPLDIRKIHRHH